MIIDKQVIATVSGRNKPHFERLGYRLPYTKDKKGRLGIKKGTKMRVDVIHLPKKSGMKIRYECDKCSVIRSVAASTIFGRDNSQYLKDGRTLCSKCANGEMSGVNNSRYLHGNVRYPEYRHNARKRGISFELSVEEFEELTAGLCHYCGGDSRDVNSRSRGNGVDRKDSALGYVLSNCVSCCATCNFVKNSMPYDEFISYIERLYKNTRKYRT